MARYDDSPGRKTSPACDVCGKQPESRNHRHVDCGRAYDVRQHAQNRIKISTHYADWAQRPDLAGKRLCPDCAEALVFGPINR